MTEERIIRSAPGSAFVGLAIVAAVVALAIHTPTSTPATRGPFDTEERRPSTTEVVYDFLVLGVFGIGMFGLFKVGPNQAAVLTFMGRYVGTCKDSGLRWTVPFRVSTVVSLWSRAREIQTIKVNDKSGKPIEIACVVIWHVTNPAAALFEVEDYERFVATQAEATLRHVAGRFVYDAPEDEETKVTLRNTNHLACSAVRIELAERCAEAGLAIDDAMITHLGYAPEIAGAMLRQQIAMAIIASRKTIVDGVVDALKKFEKGESQQTVVPSAERGDRT